MLRIILPVVLLFFFRLSAEAQVDSLLLSLDQATNEERVVIYDELSYQTLNSDLELADSYSDSALAIARRIGNDSLIVLALNGLSIPQIYSGDFNSAAATLEEGIRLNDELRDPRREGALQVKLGNVYQEQKKLSEAQEAFEASIRWFKEAGDEAALAQAYSNLASLLNYVEQYNEAITFANNAANILRKYNAAYPLGNAFGTIANAYTGLENFSSAIAYLDSAAFEYEKVGHQQGLALVMLNKGFTYRKMGMAEDGLESYREAVRIAEDYGDQATANNARANIASVLADLGRHDEALAINREAYARAQEQQVGTVILQTLNGMLENHIALGQTDEAMDAKKRYDSVRDSINTLERERSLMELQTRFDIAETERDLAESQLQIAKQNEAIAAQQRQLYMLIGSIIIIVLTVGWVMYTLRSRKERELQEAVIAEQQRGIKAVILATEEERQRIARDLHDGIGQQLNAIRLSIENSMQVEASLSTADLKELSAAFSRSADDVRTLSHRMMPKALKEEGLVKALGELLKNSFGKTSISYNLEHRMDAVGMSEEQEVTIYRVVQELISNIIKHAQAKEVDVQLLAHRDKIVLLVEDDGVGISADAKGEGHGLLNIKSRLAMIGGKARFEAGDEKGTVVTIQIPRL